MTDFESVSIRQTARLALIAEDLDRLADELLSDPDHDRTREIGERLTTLSELAKHPDRA